MNTMSNGEAAVGAPGSIMRLEQEARIAHDRGDYYSWGKIQAELDRLYVTSKMKPIAGCNCLTCKRLKIESPSTPPQPVTKYNVCTSTPNGSIQTSA